jgi:hypothetical protein
MMRKRRPHPSGSYMDARRSRQCGSSSPACLIWLGCGQAVWFDSTALAAASTGDPASISHSLIITMREQRHCLFGLSPIEREGPLFMPLRIKCEHEGAGIPRLSFAFALALSPPSHSWSATSRTGSTSHTLSIVIYAFNLLYSLTPYLSYIRSSPCAPRRSSSRSPSSRLRRALPRRSRTWAFPPLMSGPDYLHRRT